MTTQRQHFRMPVSRCGLVMKDHTTTLCAITDITDKGLQFSTDLLLNENDTVRIECQLDADCIIQCELVVTHAETPRYGGRITHLLPEHQQQLALFIQRLIISGMAGL
jgi:PilZ domain